MVEWIHRIVDLFQTQPEWFNSDPMYILSRRPWKSVDFFNSMQILYNEMSSSIMSAMFSMNYSCRINLLSQFPINIYLEICYAVKYGSIQHISPVTISYGRDKHTIYGERRICIFHDGVDNYGVYCTPFTPHHTRIGSPIFMHLNGYKCCFKWLHIA